MTSQSSFCNTEGPVPDKLFFTVLSSFFLILLFAIICHSCRKNLLYTILKQEALCKTEVFICLGCILSTLLTYSLRNTLKLLHNDTWSFRLLRAAVKSWLPYSERNLSAMGAKVPYIFTLAVGDLIDVKCTRSYPQFLVNLNLWVTILDAHIATIYPMLRRSHVSICLICHFFLLCYIQWLLYHFSSALYETAC